MKEPRISSTRKGGRPPALSKKSSNTKLFADDHVTVGKLTGSWGKAESEVIRLIVSDWLRSNRVRALGRDEASEQVRAVYERVVSEQVAPLARDIAEIRRALGAAELSPAPGDAVSGLRSLVEQAASDLSESGALQLERIERLESALAFASSLLGETFSSVWMVRDWLIRFVVEVDMAGQNKQPDDIDDAVQKEKLVLLREAYNIIRRLHDTHETAPDFRISLTELDALSGAQSPSGGRALGA